jgi:hypothetical protein
VQVSVDGGELRVTALAGTDAELEIALTSGEGRLVPGTFTVQNVPGAVRTMYGFYNPVPGDPQFLGFNTERLSPPGTFVLERIAPDRVLGTFGFRGNPIADGQTAPDGSATTLLTDGVVDLTYR